MILHLKGHTAVVIGAVRGIGRAIADTFAAEKANVAIVDREKSVAETAAEIARTNSIQAVARVADVTEYPQMCTAAVAINEEFGRIDHVVFAVGIGSGKFGFPFWNLHPEDWPQVLTVNLVGAVNAAHAFVEAIKQSKGTMTFLASVSGQIGSQTDPPYSASKAGLINFAQCAARDLAPYGVRVNSVNPGMVKTELNRSIWEAWANQHGNDRKQSYEEWANEKINRVVPLGRWQTPEDIARMVVFLASPCAENVTGQTINVDGGFVMHW